MKMFLVLLIFQEVVCENYIRMSRGSSNFDNFYFTVNEKFSLLLDTGSSPTWIVSKAYRRGGMDMARNKVHACTRTVTYGSGYSIKGSQCVLGQLFHGNFKWNTEVIAPHGSVSWWLHHGIVGASPRSEFARAFPIFTLVPYADHMRVYTQNFVKPMHVFAPITSQGMTYEKWIIEGEIEIGMKRARVQMEIDTGYPALSLSESLWGEFSRVVQINGGVMTGQKTRGYGHIIDRCFPQTVPDVYYTFGKWKKRVNAKNFTTFERNGQCIVYLIIREANESYLYLGSPFLRSTITQFDASGSRVGFRDVL